jgi:hypothetical protein
LGIWIGLFRPLRNGRLCCHRDPVAGSGSGLGGQSTGSPEGLEAALGGTVALPVFLMAIFLSTEMGSIPGRFSEALQPDPNVDYQVMQDGEFQGRGPGDVSRYVTAIFFDNKTDELAYIDASNRLISISIFRPDGTEAAFKEYPQTTIRDEEGALREFLPIQPGEAELVHFEVVWQLDAPLGDPTETYADGSWSYDGFTAYLVLDPMSGADLESEIVYEPNVLNVEPWQ